MPIVYHRIAGDTQYGTTPVDVPVHLLDESLGFVRLWLRELPAGLYREIEDHIAAAEDQLIPLRKLIAWGVAGHDANEFVEQTAEGQVPIPYQNGTDEYHGKKWSVAHPDTVAMYERALPKGVFLYSIRAALSFYHIGSIPTPRVVWDSARGKTTSTPIQAQT